jgi:hypothetical protein
MLYLIREQTMTNKNRMLTSCVPPCLSSLFSSNKMNVHQTMTIFFAFFFSTTYTTCVKWHGKFRHRKRNKNLLATINGRHKVIRKQNPPSHFSTNDYQDTTSHPYIPQLTYCTQLFTMFSNNKS